MLEQMMRRGIPSCSFAHVSTMYYYLPHLKALLLSGKLSLSGFGHTEAY
jgi:hypothetical protein